MSQPLSDYFVAEAGEYLAQLDRVLAAPAPPAPEDLLRLARGVSGSARMAGAETIASVAERLEDAARSIVSRNIVWSEEVRGLAAQTVRDLQILLRALNRWGPAEERRVRDAIERWEEGTADVREVVEIDALFHDDEGPHVLSSPGTVPAEPEPLPIEALLLRGDAALREALALRPRVEEALRGEPGAPSLDDVIAELFELLTLAAAGDDLAG